MDAQCHYIGTLARPLPIYVVPYLFGLFSCLKLKKKAVLVRKTYEPDHIWTKNEWIYWSLHSLNLVVKKPGKRRGKKCELDN
jgi:hypothetical protein